MSRDKQRIDAILDLLRQAWMAAPELRLSQLISNAATIKNPEIKDIFYVTDADIKFGLIEQLELVKTDTSITHITPSDGNIFADLNLEYPEILLNQAENKIRPSVALSENREAVRQIVFLNNATNPCVFGSVLYGTDTYVSDLDLLVYPTPDMVILDITNIMDAFHKLLGVRVNVFTLNSLPHDLRSQVLSEAQPI